jgi:arabinose-5-phosphate isomerase
MNNKLKLTTLPMASSHIAVGQAVLHNEAQALLRMSDVLHLNFHEAVEQLLAMKGRVIVTGMGKSGHVARKIAATLASTGQPAYFVHPAEASHGDMGMITTDDVVIALSNSGETFELSHIIDFTRRYKIPLIAVTRREESTLVKCADIALVLPDLPEACPMGLAPTTSTTMMLALGDALAVALLKARDFSPSDFQIFHPGGSLGGRLKKVRDCMHSGNALPLVAIDSLMSEALLEMSAKGFGCVGVLTLQQDLAGIITDGDLRRHMGPELVQQPVQNIMSLNPTTIQADALMSEALAVMNIKKITSLFVQEETNMQPIGLIHIHDCLRSGVM